MFEQELISLDTNSEQLDCVDEKQVANLSKSSDSSKVRKPFNTESQGCSGAVRNQ